MRKNNVFCREFANARPTKELKAFCAFPKSLPYFGDFTDFIFAQVRWCRPPCKVSKDGIALIKDTRNCLEKVMKISPLNQTNERLLSILWYRVSQKKHSHKFFGLEIMLFTCSRDDLSIGTLPQSWMIKEALWGGMDGLDWKVIIGYMYSILRAPSVLIIYNFSFLKIIPNTR